MEHSNGLFNSDGIIHDHTSNYLHIQGAVSFTRSILKLQLLGYSVGILRVELE